MLLADKTEDVIDESADMLHCLFGLAELMKFDLLDATERKFAVNRSRKWGNPDERGVISHVDKVE